MQECDRNVTENKTIFFTDKVFLDFPCLLEKLQELLYIMYIVLLLGFFMSDKCVHSQSEDKYSTI